MEQIDGDDWKVGYAGGVGVKLHNRRIMVAQNSRTGEWWFKFKKYDSGEIKRQSIRLSDESMNAMIGCINEISRTT